MRVDVREKRNAAAEPKGPGGGEVESRTACPRIAVQAFLVQGLLAHAALLRHSLPAY